MTNDCRPDTVGRWLQLAERIIEAIEGAGHRFGDRPTALSIVNRQIEFALRRRNAVIAGSDRDYENNIDFGRNDSEFAFRLDDSVSQPNRQYEPDRLIASVGI